MQKTTYQALVLSEIFPPQVGGSGKWLWDIYQRLDTGQYIIFCNHHLDASKIDQAYPQEVVRCKLHMVNRSISNTVSLFSYAKQILRIWKEVKRTQPISIHAARPLSEGLVGAAVSKLTNRPLICFVHGEDISVAETSRELKMLTNFVLQTSTRIIANSSFTGELLRDRWSVAKTRITIMNPGVDCTKFTPRDSYTTANKTPSFKLFTAGRLQKRKGHDAVIRAISKLKDRIPEIQYTIAGEGEEKKTLQTLAAKMGVSERVKFMGEVSDEELLSLYHECDVFILANREINGDVEGFGIVLLEAQACGKPVIAGKSGGTLDTLTHKKTGFLIDANPENICEVLLKELHKPQQRLTIGRQAREWVQSNFDWENAREKAEQAFRI